MATVELRVIEGGKAEGAPDPYEDALALLKRRREELPPDSECRLVVELVLALARRNGDR